MSSNEELDAKQEEFDECVIPAPIPPVSLRGFLLDRDERQERFIIEYMTSECEDEDVLHLEKITSESVQDLRFDVWDVHTDKNRWWVITNPTNLYDQGIFPSMDVALSMHIGLTMRVMERQARKADTSEQQQRFATSWRLYGQAAEALSQADEAEEFQAAGMLCRECLLSLVRAVIKDGIVPTEPSQPRAGDFLHWSEIIADLVAHGSSAQEIRGYLKSLARSAWQMANWLTHATNAVRFDCHMVLDSVRNTLGAFGIALIRYEVGTPDRCPFCASYRITRYYEPEFDIDPPYVTACESCGWNDLDQKLLQQQDSVQDDRTP